MRIDFHSHILPAMDDGASDTEESLLMLELLKQDGVDAVVATPHLYSQEQGAAGFLEKRAKRFTELQKAAKGGGYPEIILGAEVYFSNALYGSPLRELCAGGTDCLLVELPYTAFSRTFLNTFASFVNGCDCSVVLAHIERYYEFNNAETINELFAYGCSAQANCDSFLNAGSRRVLLKLIESGAVKFLGTDSHSLKYRPPNFGKAESVIRKKLSDKAFEDMMEASRSILNL